MSQEMSEHHRKRAEEFRVHAEQVKSPYAREMYLRMAATEEALADQAASKDHNK